MTNKEIKIAYQECESLDQLESQDRKLAEAAIAAIATSYAPYSNFNVGAAVLLAEWCSLQFTGYSMRCMPSGDGSVPA